MIHKTDMEEIMYQKIIELLRIHGYLSQDTEKGPCYVKSTKKRNKCVLNLPQDNICSSSPEDHTIEPSVAVYNKSLHSLPQTK